MLLSCRWGRLPESYPCIQPHGRSMHVTADVHAVVRVVMQERRRSEDGTWARRRRVASRRLELVTAGKSCEHHISCYCADFSADCSNVSCCLFTTEQLYI